MLEQNANLSALSETKKSSALFKIKNKRNRIPFLYTPVFLFHFLPKGLILALGPFLFSFITPHHPYIAPPDTVKRLRTSDSKKQFKKSPKTEVMTCSVGLLFQH